MLRCNWLLLAIFALLLSNANQHRSVVANEPTTDDFASQVQPYVQKYCVECHREGKAKGDLDLTQFKNAADVIANFRRWNNVIEFIRQGEMPPQESLQPSIEESNAVVAAIEAIMIVEAKKQAGDPGVVLPRRLSNSEYDLSIRDLTGVPILATKDFPPDPAGGEGFDNTGEALGMSPNLLKKYLAAAQFVADHLVLKTDGIAFANDPVTSYNERQKLTEQAIIRFYESRQVDTLKYLEAAWRFRFRSEEQRELNVEQWLASRSDSGAISGRYLALVANFFANLNPSEVNTAMDPSSELRQAWLQLPPPVDESSRPPAGLTQLAELVEHYRRILNTPVEQLIRANAGNWPISHLDFRAKVAAARDRFSTSSLQSEVVLRPLRVTAPKAEPRNNKEPEKDTANNDEQTQCVKVRVEPALGTAASFVIVKQALFSKADRLSNNDRERGEHQVQTLRSVLEASHPELASALAFGKHPLGGEIDADAFVLSSPTEIEIPLTAELRQQLADKHLLLACELDGQRSSESAVWLEHEVWLESTGDGQVKAKRTNKAAGRTSLLVRRDGPAAKALEPFGAAFCNAFPNRFYYVDQGRGLAAGFHLVEGFFRDDQPLMQKVLSEAEIAELNQLWRELEFVTEGAETLLRGFVWFERSEREVLHDKRFDFLRSEDPQLVEPAMLDKFEKLYLDKLGVKRVGDSLEAENPDAKYQMVRSFFTEIRNGLQRYVEQLVESERLALQQIEDLAARAYRRPLEPRDRESLQTLYQRLRNDGLEVEPALRGLFIAILMSPEFCYRYQHAPEGTGRYALTDLELASRLSYFVWSTMPDAELMAAAMAGKLANESELRAQTQRMLRDDRVSAFAREFFGQWLRYRDYLTKDPIDATTFPGYDDELRESMFEEPTRLATYLIQNDRPLTELLTSDTTFINRRLAKHYGGELERQYQAAVEAGIVRSLVENSELHRKEAERTQAWQSVSGLRQVGRGGLLGMAVVLTKNSAGNRTSPVKRGFWSVHHLLGQHFPPPPADVPELPKSEKTAERTIRELLAAHVENQQCAMCHKHFDAIGIAMEGFDAIGRSRSTDLAGRPVDSRADLPNGKTAAGIPELIEYIDGERRDEFVRTLCRKFLGYALGRSVQLSDQPLLQTMESELKQADYRFSVLFDTVIRSPQFRQQRGRDYQVNNN